MHCANMTPPPNDAPKFAAAQLLEECHSNIVLMIVASLVASMLRV